MLAVFLSRAEKVAVMLPEECMLMLLVLKLLLATSSFLSVICSQIFLQ